MNFSKLSSAKMILTLLCVVLIQSAHSQVSRFSVEKFSNEKGETLPYRLLYPDYNTVRKYPLVVFLHGPGERGTDNEAQLKWGVANFASDENMKLYPSFVLAPQCPLESDWSNFSDGKEGQTFLLQKTPSKPMELLMALLEETIKKYPIDTNRIYITGLSMGGFGTFDAIERYPNLFAAAVPVCGGGDTSLASSIKHIPIWVFHGAEDVAVDPACSLTMISALTKAGAHPGYKQYPEVGHFSWLMAYSDSLLMEWLFRQRK